MVHNIYITNLYTVYILIFVFSRLHLLSFQLLPHTSDTITLREGAKEEALSPHLKNYDQPCHGEKKKKKKTPAVASQNNNNHNNSH